jgi:hypothetical protein
MLVNNTSIPVIQNFLRAALNTYNNFLNVLHIITHVVLTTAIQDTLLILILQTRKLER